MYEILKSERLVPNIHLLKIESEFIPKKARPGQFVILQADERGERIPLTLADWDEEGITVIFLTIGTSTRKLAALKEGDSLYTLVGPLGRPTEISSHREVLGIGGCYGIGAIYPALKAFQEAGSSVRTIIEARSANLFYWTDRLSRVSGEILYVTRDGSKGFTGHIDQFLKDYLKENHPDLVYVVGCTFLLYLVAEATRPFGIKTIVSLNPIMIDGTGMCGVCRVIVGGKTKFACVDGPEFDGHEVDWNVLFARKHSYFDEELRSLSFFECERYG
ncbi:sulfide/dihydroorotate dehydrogenase-like FAD/NAD-binding protein [candidate division WOR-3 bacterium]|uniref:Sulfide/dihydroorotate dehydrogenase-like FAD/NAD-binding protein n=1 Tax=candidate division WOR-3 bacterium TaxID=2052148 RepID=A0A660SK10_UNCW3|nr:MAG: sulfide/dihydroorotate dehydrogenase-like FAD/NAD-binding protein [candidate division WOR-3 bacterium]